MAKTAEKISTTLSTEVTSKIRLLNRIDGDKSLQATIEKALREYIKKNQGKIDKFNEAFEVEKTAR